MASVTDICNLALTQVGAKVIMDIDADAAAGIVEAIVCKAQYSYARDMVLEATEWTFSVERTNIAADPDAPEFGYTTSFKKPKDCLHVLEVWDGKKQNVNSQYTSNPLQWQVEGDYINADTTEIIYVKYQKRIEDTNKYSASFIQALSLYLSYKISIPLTNSRSLQNDMYALYKEHLSEASMQDGTQGRMRVMRVNTLMGNRFR